MIFEMREARRRFAEGHEETLVLPRVPVPSGLEQVLGGHRSSDGADGDEAAGGTGAAVSGAPGCGNRRFGCGKRPSGCGKRRSGCENRRQIRGNTLIYLR